MNFGAAMIAWAVCVFLAALLMYGIAWMFGMLLWCVASFFFGVMLGIAREPQGDADK